MTPQNIYRPPAQTSFKLHLRSSNIKAVFINIIVKALFQMPFSHCFMLFSFYLIVENVDKKLFLPWTDAIFALRGIISLSKEFHKKFALQFVHFRKVFDSVNREAL